MSVTKLSISGLLGLGRAAARPRSLMTRRIGAELRELIILHVSSVNECVVCSAIHEAGARACGIDEESIRAARQRVDEAALDDRTRAALRYAELRTRGAEADDPAACDAFEELFDEQERAEVRTVVDLMTFNNQFNNSWEGLLPGAARRRRRMGLGTDPNRQ